MPFSDLSAVDVFRAAKRLRGVAKRTELRHSLSLSERVGADVYLKLECEQITGSFKLRGAYNAIACLQPEMRERGVIAWSAGNHGLGVAWAARHFGIAATIFVPASAPAVKRDGIAALGATIDASQPDYDLAMAAAKSLAAQRGCAGINPCAGETLIAGQGTVGLEILEDLPEVGTLVVPVGGAGLLAGQGSLFRRVAPEVHIAGVQGVNSDAMARSLAAHSVISIGNIPTLADGLAGDIDAFALDVGEHTLDELVILTEEEIAHGIAWLFRTEQIRVEGSGAVGVAALLAGKLQPPRSPIAVILSGRNIDEARLQGVLKGEE